jgi:hypothetical protein
VSGYCREVRGLPLWLLREYLLAAGGHPAGDGRVVGDGWTATLTQLEDFQIGSLRVGQVRLEIDAAPDILAALETYLEPKLLRGGG